MRIYFEARIRGWNRTVKGVAIGDGSEWIWNSAEPHFPGATQTVDVYHARQHLWDIAWSLHPYDPAGRQRRMDIHKPRLDDGRIEELADLLRATTPTTPALAEFIRSGTGYFERRRVRMRYSGFRNLDLFAGSGVIDAGCRTVAGQHLKQSGMFWAVLGCSRCQ